MSDLTEQLEGYLISPQQKRQWRRFQEGNTVHMVTTLLLQGADADMARSLVNALVARHDSLRTCFVVPPNRKDPIQVVMDDLPPTFTECTPLETLDDSSHMLEAKAKAQPFDPAAGPMLHTFYLQQDAHNGLLTLTWPALCGDSLNQHTLATSLAASFRNDEEPVQYVQYSEWLQELVEEDPGSAAFWETAAQREATPLLPGFQDGLREGPTSSTPLNHLPAATHLGAYEPDLFFLACWHTWLGRLSGGSVIDLAVRFSGRSDEDLLETFGPFERNLPVAQTYHPELSVDALYGELAETMQVANEYQDYFGLTESTLPYAFAYSQPAQAASIENMSMQPFRNHPVPGTHLLQLEVWEDRHNQMQAHLRYDRKRCPGDMIPRLAQGFEALVQAAIADPSQAVGNLPLLSKAEHQRLIETWNQTGADNPMHLSVPQRFAQQAAANPIAPALICEDTRLDYEALAAAVFCLANHLRARGVGPEIIVASCCDRNQHSIVAMLGIMAAGGVFMPLDPTFPPARAAALIDDAGARLLVSHTGLTLPEVDTLLLDEMPTETVDTSAPSMTIQGTQGAYLIFTSGSTGKPKGVMVTHNNLNNYLFAVTQALDLKDASSFACVSTQAADLGYTTIFPPLVQGGALHLIGRERLGDAEGFAAYMHAAQVDILKITPSHLAALMDHAEPARALPRKALILGGEFTPAQQVRRIRKLAPDLAVHNHYGPTETTIGVLTHTYNDDRPDFFPLGRPLANNRIYLLDDQGQPVPTGFPGEIVVAGSNVARGYLNRPDLTQMRFMADPFQPQARAYRTGDLARYDEEGYLHFLGRKDQQLKIRGFRVEPGEIEAMLNHHPDVRRALVLPLEAADGNKRLAAYIMSENTDTTQTREILRRHLAEQLPAYMVPAYLVMLPEFPLTANGKVDRKRLPDPMELGETAFKAPTTPDEVRMAGIWSDLLHQANPGVTQNFFDLGGDSLNGTILMSRIGQVFGGNLKLAALFQAPTISGLLAEIYRARIAAHGYDAVLQLAGETRAQTLAELSPERLTYLASLLTDSTQVLEAIPTLHREDGCLDAPLSLSQERFWFLDRMEGSSSTYNVTYSLHLEGPLDREALNAALTNLVARHEILRTIFVEVDGTGIQRVLPPFPVALPLTDRQNDPQADSEDIRKAVHDTPFDLSKGPLLRFHLVQQGPEDHILYAALHHIVSDGWSVAVITRELADFYRAQRRGTPPDLEPLPIQFADFAHWQQERMRTEASDQVTYWRQRLAGTTDLPLPTDFPRPEVQTYGGASHQSFIQGQTAEAMNQLMRDTETTPFAFLMAGYALMLSRYAQTRDVVVGTTTANRARPEVEHLVGCFINQLAIRTELKGNPTFRQLLHQVRQTTTEAYDYQELPFGSLVSELKWPRKSDRSPIFQVLLVHQNIQGHRFILDDLRMTPNAVEAGVARFDLSLFTAETPKGYSLYWTYNTDLFTRATIAKMSDHLDALFQGATAQPDAPVDDLEMKTQDEIESENARKARRKKSSFAGMRGARRESMTTGDVDRGVNS